MGSPVSGESNGKTTVRASEWYNFFGKQWEATKAVQEYDFILYGGCRGPGKSHWLRRVIPYWLTTWMKEYNLRNMNAMLACESYTALQDRQLNALDQELPEWLGVMKNTQIDGLHIQMHESWGGHKILLRNLQDPDKYKSGQYAIIAIDQIEQIPEQHFWKINGSRRWPGLPRAKFISAGNPLGVGHAWNVNYFIDHIFPSHVDIELQKQFYFVPATPYDNPYLSQQYWDFLNSLDKTLRRAWLEGDYHFFAGQAFPTFTYNTHVIKWTDPAIEGWESWPAKWRAIDWGFRDPYCCYWMMKHPTLPRVVVYRETWKTNLTDRQQAKDIKENTPPNEIMNINYADPSMWAKKNRGGAINDEPTSAADIYADEGIPLTAADNNRMNGMRKFRSFLEPIAADGRPGFLILETCYNLWRTIPQLVLEETGEDIVHDRNHKQDDHGYDAACRYGLTNQLDTRIAPQPKKPAPSPLEELMRG